MSGPAQLEFERTKEILAWHLPAPPARVLDVGGAAGAYSLWLASLGYEVHLIDTSARLVAEARAYCASAGSSPLPASHGTRRHSTASPRIWRSIHSSSRSAIRICETASIAIPRIIRRTSRPRTSTRRTDCGRNWRPPGFDERRVLGVEGPAWILPDFDKRWADPAQREVIVDAARLLEAQPSVIGASAHLLGLAWKK